MQNNKTTAETIIAADKPREKAAGSMLVIWLQRRQHRSPPPNCLADAINPDAMPASCAETDESIELVIDGTDVALPIPATIKAMFRYQNDVLQGTPDNVRNPAT